MMVAVLVAMGNSFIMSIMRTSNTTLFLVGASCFFLGYIVAAAGPAAPSACVRGYLCWMGAILTSRNKKKQQQQNQQESASLEIENLAGILEDFKMVLVVRNDLKMGKGKIAAQCSHATLGLYKKLFRKAPKTLSWWETSGQAKVVLKCESEEDLLILQQRAKSLKLPTHITIDAGRTQIAPNSRTVMAILGPVDVVDDVTGGLKLL